MRNAVLPLFFALGIVCFSESPSFAGRWDGTLSMGNEILEFNLSILENGMLMDVPDQKVFNFPVDGPEISQDGGFHAFLPTGGALVELEGVREGNTVSGGLSFDGTVGSFTLVASGTLDDPDTGYPVHMGEFTLHGDLLVPASVSKPPLVILVAGSGPTDRNGNSYSVPGKCDSLKQLAEAFLERGIATYRYDKRGAATGFFFLKDEASFVFEDYIRDAGAIIRHFKESGRFSSVSVAGHSEGALVATVASNGADGLILLAGAGFPIDLVLMKQLSQGELETGMFSESEAIIERLKKGETVSDVSEPLLGLFRPSVQPYMISWMKYDPAAEIAKVTVPALIVQGDTDLQISMEDTDALRNGNRDASVSIIRNMNHVLKAVDGGEEKNWESYSNPDFPLGEGLVAAVADFVLGIGK